MVWHSWARLRGPPVIVGRHADLQEGEEAPIHVVEERCSLDNAIAARPHPRQAAAGSGSKRGGSQCQRPPERIVGLVPSDGGKTPEASSCSVSSG